MNAYEMQRRELKALKMVEVVDALGAQARELGFFQGAEGRDEYAFHINTLAFDENQHQRFWRQVEQAAGVKPSSQRTRLRVAALLYDRVSP